MNRRRFLKASAAGAAAACVAACANSLSASSAAEAPATAPAKAMEKVSLCGLYCDTCSDNATGECHGCGCSCGKCAGSAHRSSCEIAICATARKLASCADCKDLPCSLLIQFTMDPVWRTHSVCIENLRRRKAIGTDAWLKEQKAYLTDERKAFWLAFHAECGKKSQGSKQPEPGSR